MFRRIGYLLLFWMLALATQLLPLSTQAQDPYFVHYKIQDGLPSLTAYSVFQDSKGFIWISTDLGVSRFNGKEFQNFSYQHGLSDNDIFNFFEDSKGRIWMHTFNGKVCYFFEEKFYNPENNPVLKKASQNRYITKIVEDSKGNIYLGSNSKNGCIISNENVVTTFQSPQEGATINYLWLNEADELYIGHQLGISKKDSEFIIQLRELEAGLTLGYVRGAENEDIVFLGVKKQLFLFDKKNNKVISNAVLEEIDTEIISVYLVDNAVWVGTRNGVLKLPHIINDNTNFTTQKYLDGYSVTSTLADNEGNYWFSTLEAGVFFSPLPKSLHLSKKDGLSETPVYTISIDKKKRIWLGSSKNTYSILEGDKISRHKLTGHSDLEITEVKHFENNQHWVLGKGLSMRVTDHDKKYLFIHTNDMLLDQYGYTWLGHSRLLRLSPDLLTRVLIDANDPAFNAKMKKPVAEIINLTPIDDKTNVCYAIDLKSRLWAGTKRGLHWYEYDKDTVIDQSKTSMVEGNITDLIYDYEKDLLWVATSINGVQLIKNDSIIDTFNNNDGLISNMITSLHLDESGTLWIGSDKGVDRLIDQNGNYEVQNYSNQLGLFNLKINDIHVIDQKTYLGTELGLIVLPQEIKQLQVEPLIQINTFKVNNEVVDTTQELSFNYKENSVEFSFTGLSYRDQEQLSYKYRLIGAEENWTHITSDRIQYRSLSPGDYRFEVKAQNATLLESKDTAHISFTIDAPFWQKWWFITLSAIALFGIIYTVLKARIRRLKKQHQLEQRLVYAENDKLEIERNFLDLEMRALRLQMNPHFMFNALNTIKGYYAQDKVREANAYISKFAQLLRLILKNDDKYISLEKEVKILNYYMLLTQIRYENVFDFDINVQEDLDQQDIAIPPMLLQPMVENAIIHGLAPRKEKGMIYISFKMENGILVSKVRDNGIGRLASEKFTKHKIHKSKATEITHERLAIINKDHQIVDYFMIDDLKKNDGSAEGTQVTIKTPLKTIWS